MVFDRVLAVVCRAGGQIVQPHFPHDHQADVFGRAIRRCRRVKKTRHVDGGTTLQVAYRPLLQSVAPTAASPAAVVMVASGWRSITHAPEVLFFLCIRVASLPVQCLPDVARDAATAGSRSPDDGE